MSSASMKKARIMGSVKQARLISKDKHRMACGTVRVRTAVAIAYACCPLPLYHSRYLVPGSHVRVVLAQFRHR